MEKFGVELTNPVAFERERRYASDARGDLAILLKT